MNSKPIPFSYVTRNGRVYDLNGNVCVLLSREYPMWSTDPCNPTSCMFSPPVIEWVMRGSHQDYPPDFKRMFGEKFCADAASMLKIELVKQGTCFAVRYDADIEAEYIQYHDHMDWQIA